MIKIKNINKLMSVINNFKNDMTYNILDKNI